jgi:hypothetical protein
MFVRLDLLLISILKSAKNANQVAQTAITHHKIVLNALKTSFY